MGKTMDAGRAVKEFCNTCFMLRKPELAAEFLDSDVRFAGAGDREYACGKQKVVDYFCKDIHNIRDAFYLEVSVIDEQPLSEEIISLSCRVDLKRDVRLADAGAFHLGAAERRVADQKAFAF